MGLLIGHQRDAHPALPARSSPADALELPVASLHVLSLSRSQRLDLTNRTTGEQCVQARRTLPPSHLPWAGPQVNAPQEANGMPHKRLPHKPIALALSTPHPEASTCTPNRPAHPLAHLPTRQPTHPSVQAWLGTHSLALSEADWRMLPYIGAALAVAGMWGSIVCYASCRFKHRLCQHSVNGAGLTTNGRASAGKARALEASYSRVEVDDPPSDGEIPKDPDDGVEPLAAAS